MRSKIEIRQRPKENRIASFQAEDAGISLLSRRLRARDGLPPRGSFTPRFHLLGG